MNKLITSCLLFVSCSIYSQSNNDKLFGFELEDNVYTISIDNDKKQFQIFYEKSHFKPKKGIVYTWYDQNQLYSTIGGYSGVLLHGSFLEYHVNGQLSYSGTFKNGIKTGAWTAWEEDGSLLRSEQWRKGKKDGVVINFDKAGKEINRILYEEGDEIDITKASKSQKRRLGLKSSKKGNKSNEN